MGFNNERPAIGINQRMTLAALDLLAGIVPARPAAFGGFNALTVDNRSRRAGLATDPLTVCDDQSVIDLREKALVTPTGKPAVHRTPWRKVARQQAPGNPTTQQIKDRVDDLAQWPSTRPTVTARFR